MRSATARSSASASSRSTATPARATGRRTLPPPGPSRPSRSASASPTAWARAAAASARAWRSSWSTTVRSRCCSRCEGRRPHLGHNARLVPPEDRFVCRFAAEPPQELLPYGRWAERLREEFLAACLRIDTEVVELGRGEEGRQAAMTLIWGTPMGNVRGVIATAELGGLAVDQCVLMDDRFTLIAPDDYRGDTLEITLWNRRGEAVATESLYEEEGEGEA